MLCDNVSVSQNCDVATIWLVVCNVELEPTLIMMINTNTGISDHTVGLHRLRPWCGVSIFSLSVRAFSPDTLGAPQVKDMNGVRLTDDLLWYSLPVVELLQP